MKSDKSAKEREVYTQEIAKREQIISELNLEQRKVEAGIANLDAELNRNFRNERDLNEEMIVVGSVYAQYAQGENDEESRRFQSILVDESEQIKRTYQKVTQKLDGEREKLLKERNELPWD